MEQHRYPFAPAFLKVRVQIDVDDLDLPARLGSDWLQRGNEVMAQMAPLPAHHGETPAGVGAVHLSARRLT